MNEAVIVSTARRPIGRAGRRAFNLTHGAEMEGYVIRHQAERAGVVPGKVEEVVLGGANPEGTTERNISRQAGFRAGLPASAAAMTVNRFCSSVLQGYCHCGEPGVCDEMEGAVARGLESISLVQSPLNRSQYRDAWLNEHVPAVYMP